MPACSLARLRFEASPPGSLSCSVNGELRRLVGRFLQQVFERVAPEIEAALERAVYAHVEPRLDALAEKLYRHAIEERSRQYGDEREQQNQPHGEPRPEDAFPEVLAQPP